MSRLLPGCPPPAQFADTAVSGLAYRSSDVTPGDVFFCVPGRCADGHDFAADAVARGAAALVVEHLLVLDVPQFVVPEARGALARAASVFYGEPSADIGVVGITGTNGKTTTTYLLDSVMRRAGKQTGVIGTVETRIGDERVPASRTTPESLDLQRLFARMRDAGVGHVSMEVSSHAVDLKRVDATAFAAVAFTNLTQDHLDYHETMEQYFAVKRQFMLGAEASARIIDVDDPYGQSLCSEMDGAISVGRSKFASVRAIDERATAAGTGFLLKTPWGQVAIELPVPGAYNVSNALCAAACALSCGVSLECVADGLAGAPQVPGRLERVDCGQPFGVLVDYAHTPDSLAKALDACRAFTTGRVIVVFGCGGDRDTDKRPLMGEAAGLRADITILTSDNPRSEDPQSIISSVETGVRTAGAESESIPDRGEAIAHAIRCARPGDTVLIAGKGHEDYQIFKDRTIHFDDREVALEVLGAC